MSLHPTDPAAGWQTLVIDGQRHALRLAGFDQPLQVGLPDGATVTLPPWRYRDHLTGLRTGLSSTGPALALDLQRYLAAMPAWADVPDDQQAALRPVALWWASGGDPAPVLPADDPGEIEIGSRRFRLSPWSDGLRQQALCTSLADDPDEGGSAGRFDAVGYLDAMVCHTVQGGPADGGVAELPSHWALPLIDAVVQLNLVRPADEPLAATGPGAPAAAAQTLRLCQALGWTPSQVWRTPAAEVDRLLDLLDRVDAAAAPLPRAAAAPAPRSRPRLADHPEAVLIRIED